MYRGIYQMATTFSWKWNKKYSTKVIKMCRQSLNRRWQYLLVCSFAPYPKNAVLYIFLRTSSYLSQHSSWRHVTRTARGYIDARCILTTRAPCWTSSFGVFFSFGLSLTLYIFKQLKSFVCSYTQQWNRSDYKDYEDPSSFVKSLISP